MRQTQKPGRYADGHGLYLVVDPTGAKRWVQRITIRGKRCDMGLGSAALVTLAEARETALANRKAGEGRGRPAASQARGRGRADVRGSRAQGA